MKNKRLSAIIAMVLTVALLAPITAAANNNGQSNPGKSSKVINILDAKPEIAAKRAEIAGLNANIVRLKSEAKVLVEKISRDLAGTKGIESITSSNDYIDIIALLKSLKGTLGKAEAHDYMSGLKKAKDKDKNIDNLSATLDSVIAILIQKKADITTAIASLNNAVVNADAIALLKTDLTKKWNDYKTQAIEKKKTIDQNHVQIVQAFADNKKIISTIIATASANKSVLETKSDAVAAIEAKLTEITNTLKGIHDGSIIATNDQFKADKKNKDYTTMLADLDKIIGIQKVRIETLADIEFQLQEVLDQLNSIIASVSSI